MKQMLVKFQSLIEDGNLEELSAALSEIESIEDMQEEYMIQLETEQMLLINKITELGQEVFSSSSLSRISSDNWTIPSSFSPNDYFCPWYSFPNTRIISASQVYVVLQLISL